MTRDRVVAAEPPAGCQAHLRLPGAHVHDCYRISAPVAEASALELLVPVTPLHKIIVKTMLKRITFV